MSRLAAAVERHQDRILARADRSADAAERAVRRVWLRLVKVIEAGGQWHRTYSDALAALHSLPAVAGEVLEDLVRAGQDARQATRATIARHLPRGARERLLARRFRNFEIPKDQPLLEARDTDALDPAADPLLELLPGPTDDAIRRIVYGTGWYDRLKALTALSSPEALAATIASGALRGLTAQELAREVRPLVQGVQTSARRVARTAGLWVAHSVEHAQWEELGDLVEGYQTHAVLDHATRPEHRKRDGTKYYRRPAAGQKGFDEMPVPPLESPRDGGKLAFNCRCFNSPIIAEG